MEQEEEYTKRRENERKKDLANIATKHEYTTKIGGICDSRGP
jgi:hypothetical protein